VKLHSKKGKNKPKVKAKLKRKNYLTEEEKEAERKASIKSRQDEIRTFFESDIFFMFFTDKIMRAYNLNFTQAYDVTMDRDNFGPEYQRVASKAFRYGLFKPVIDEV
jgi:hypothetical protein